MNLCKLPRVIFGSAGGYVTGAAAAVVVNDEAVFFSAADEVC